MYQVAFSATHQSEIRLSYTGNRKTVHVGSAVLLLRVKSLSVLVSFRSLLGGRICKPTTKQLIDSFANKQGARGLGITVAHLLACCRVISTHILIGHDVSKQSCGVSRSRRLAFFIIPGQDQKETNIFFKKKCEREAWLVRDRQLTQYGKEKNQRVRIQSYGIGLCRCCALASGTEARQAA